MTRGGLSIDQKMVDQFVESIIKESKDFGKPISLDGLGFDGTLGFSEIRDYFSRGLCLELQRKERGPSERIKDPDILGATKSDDPVAYLREKGYSERLLKRVFKL